jgi:hypothetical protein
VGRVRAAQGFRVSPAFATIRWRQTQTLEFSDPKADLGGMDLSIEFEIEDPDVVVRWTMSEEQLLQALPSQPHWVTSGYYTLDCTSLNGLQCVLGFHFWDGRLGELEFFRRDYSDLQASYDDFQRHLEATFGPPTDRDDGSYSKTMPHYVWEFDGAEVRHGVLDRFGPEEHVSLRPLPG